MVAGGICIGVLGGIGPEATGEFYSTLIRRIQERGLVRCNRDYPHIIVNSIPAPELTGDTISDAQLHSYVHGIEELERFGAHIIVMVCNTIHLYRERLQLCTTVPIVDLQQEVRNKLASRGITVLLIGTPSTIRNGLYRGPHTIDPDGEELAVLSDAMGKFNCGIDKEEQVRRTLSICRRHLRVGATEVLLGCTEFAVMLDNAEIPTINTIDILVEATIERCLQITYDKAVRG